MRKAGYKDKMATAICRALFCEQSEKQLQRAFKFYDTDKSGFLDAVEFREALPLMGENVPEERINELFRKTAIDESGCINFEGFCKLVKAMNPKKKKQAAKESDPISVFSDAVNRVARTWAAKTRDLQDVEEPEHRKSHPRKKDSASRGSGSSAGSADPSSALGGSEGSASQSSAARVVLPPKSQRVSVQKYNP